MTSTLILFCEGYTKPVEVDFAKVRDLIYQDICEKKQRLSMGDYFEHLQETATVDNYLAGTSKSPPKSASSREGFPGLPTAYREPARR